MLQRQDVRNASAAFAQFLERTFERKFRSKWAGSNSALCLQFVAVTGFDVHDRRYAATEFGSESTGVYIRIGYHIRIKNTEQANAVECVVHDHAIQQHLVLNRRTAAYVQLSALVASAYEARQNLQRLHQVGLASKTGDFLQITRTNGLYRHVDFGRLFFPVGIDLRALQLDDILLQEVIARHNFVVDQNHLFGKPFEFHA